MGISLLRSDVKVNILSVQNNSALDGAGIFANFSSISGSVCQYNFNTAITRGGALTLLDSSLRVSECEVKYNRAGSGAGIYANIGTINLKKSALNGNVATQNGGALAGEKILVDIELIESLQNQAQSGGFAFCKKCSIGMNSCAVGYNVAHDDGGALSTVDSNISMNYTSVHNNSADFGGGLNGYKSTIDIYRASFDNNTAYIGGGGVNVEFSLLKLDESAFSDNDSPAGSNIRGEDAIISTGSSDISPDTILTEGNTIITN